MIRSKVEAASETERSDTSTGLLFLLVGLVATWMSFGRLHDFQNADSILPVLVSLQHWTPFFWGQDRFGMLVPLLATPFHNPLTNLLLQGWLNTVAALLVPFLVARYLKIGRDWFAAGALANVLTLLMFTPAFRFDWLVTQPYGVSMTLAFAGLLIVERTGAVNKTAAALLLVAAHWVNFAVLLVVVPSVLVRGRLVLRSLDVTGLGIAGGWFLKQLSSAPTTTVEIVSIGDWAHGWLQLLHMVSGMVGHPLWLAIVVALAAMGAIAIARYSSVDESIRAAGMAVIIAGVCWLVVGTLKQVQLNQYYPRYMLPSVVSLDVAVAIILVAPVRQRRGLASAIACFAFITCAVVSYGVPSLPRLKQTLDLTCGPITPEIIAARATVIIGDYWTVWPAVFHANLALYKETGQSRVFGLTYRSDPTDPIWSSGLPGKPVILAARASDKTVGRFIARLGMPITFLEIRGSLALFVTGTR